MSYCDWGHLLKVVVICPGLRHVVAGDKEDLKDNVEEEGITSAVSNDSDSDGDDNEEASEIVVYGGFLTGYDLRETQTLWARPPFNSAGSEGWIDQSNRIKP